MAKVLEQWVHWYWCAVFISYYSIIFFNYKVKARLTFISKLNRKKKEKLNIKKENLINFSSRTAEIYGPWTWFCWHTSCHSQDKRTCAPSCEFSSGPSIWTLPEKVSRWACERGSNCNLFLFEINCILVNYVITCSCLTETFFFACLVFNLDWI